MPYEVNYINDEDTISILEHEGDIGITFIQSADLGNRRKTHRVYAFSNKKFKELLEHIEKLKNNYRDNAD